MTVLLLGSSQTHLGTAMPSGGGHIIRAYDNMHTAVDRVGRGKERQINMRFVAMTNHYVYEPEFCNPAAGWEKGQVEKNVRAHIVTALRPHFRMTLLRVCGFLQDRSAAIRVVRQFWSHCRSGRHPGASPAGKQMHGDIENAQGSSGSIV